jgi:hypothetical protein
LGRKLRMSNACRSEEGAQQALAGQLAGPDSAGRSLRLATTSIRLTA